MQNITDIEQEKVATYSDLHSSVELSSLEEGLQLDLLFNRLSSSYGFDLYNSDVVILCYYWTSP